jgi:hypothetical protein
MQTVYTLNLGAGLAGLADLRAVLVDAAGASVRTYGAGFIDLGGGQYMVTIDIPTAHRGAIRFYRAAEPAKFYCTLAVNPTSAPLGSTGIPSAVGDDGSLTLVRGDDYTSDVGRKLEWSGEAWPDLTDATISFSARSNRTGNAIEPIEGSVMVAGEGMQTIALELGSGETEDLEPGDEAYLFDLQAEIGGKFVTLVRGSIDVLEDVGEDEEG